MRTCDQDRALQIDSLWGDTLLHRESFACQPEVHIEDFGPILAESLGDRGTNYAILIPEHARARIEHRRGSETCVGPLRYNLQESEAIQVVLASLELHIRYVPRVQLAPPALRDRLDYRWLDALLLALVFHFVAILIFILTPRGQPFSAELLAHRARFVQVGLTPAAPAPSRSRSAPLTVDKAAPLRRAPGGQRDAAKSLASLFGDAKVKKLFASSTDGGALEKALSNVVGIPMGDAGGGLGLRGHFGGPGGPGIGDASPRSVGIGPLRRLPEGYGSSDALTMLVKSDTEVVLDQRRLRIVGALDKEVIRNVIRRHMAQIRYCYELALVLSPGLFGKISTRFTIGSAGEVTSVEVEQSTARDAKLERCIADRIARWRFPKPKGGGEVEVHYPIIVTSAG